MGFELGQSYSRAKISAVFGGDIRSSLPESNGIVVCGCFKTASRWNPGAPEEVTLGIKPRVRAAARKLQEQSATIPIFLFRENSEWEYIGDYRCIRYEEDKELCDQKMRENPERGPIGGVLHFERAFGSTEDLDPLNQHGCVPTGVRILPMSLNEFDDCHSIKDLQQKFFLQELPSREYGRYHYLKRGLQAKRGTVVLFQCNAQVIASAVLTRTERFEKPTDGGYQGSLNFDVTSIRVFDPVGPEKLRKIWSGFRGFSQSRQKLDPQGFFEFIKQLTGEKFPQKSPPTEEAIDFVSLPERVHANLYRILRDTELARRVKFLHRYECQICGHTIELPNGGRYAESHHIQPLGQPHDGPDIIGNILCVCPNHHAELDYGVSRLSLSSLRNSDGHTIDLKYIEYHNDKVFKQAESGIIVSGGGSP